MVAGGRVAGGSIRRPVESDDGKGTSAGHALSTLQAEHNEHRFEQDQQIKVGTLVPRNEELILPKASFPKASLGPSCGLKDASGFRLGDVGF